MQSTSLHSNEDQIDQEENSDNDDNSSELGAFMADGKDKQPEEMEFKELESFFSSDAVVGEETDSHLTPFNPH